MMAGLPFSLSILDFFKKTGETSFENAGKVCNGNTFVKIMHNKFRKIYDGLVWLYLPEDHFIEWPWFKTTNFPINMS